MLFEFSEIKVPDKKSELFDINTGFELGNMYECLYSSYKKYEPREIKAKNEREMLFLNILKLSFAINDLNLYLDIHPDDEKTYELFVVSDALISDFSSIIFDYSILDKPMYFFVPDLKDYMHRLGCFVDYKKEMPGPLCYNEEELTDAIHSNEHYDIKRFKNKFFKYQDGKNVERVIALIEQLIKED